MWRHITLVAILLVGCSGTSAPTGTSSLPTVSPAPTAQPTSTESASATASPDPVPTASAPTDRARGPNDVLLRMSTTGGLPYPGDTVELPAQFTLYGDGHVIYFVYTPEGGIEVRHARVTDERADELLAFALDEGGLGRAKELYGQLEQPVHDFETTTFEIHSGGVDKTVSVYALGVNVVGPDAGVRQALAELALELEFRDDIARGDAADLGVYEPEAYLITLDEVYDPVTADTDWPWDNLTLADFEPSTDGNYGRVVSPAVASALADPPTSALDNIAVTASDGKDYFIRLRPLLPDELPEDWPNQERSATELSIASTMH